MARKKRTLALALAVIFGSAAVLATQASASSRPSFGSPTPVPISPNSASLSELIGSIASSQFPDGYASDIQNADGSVTVYATPAVINNLAAVLAQSLPGGSEYTLVPVAHSFSELESLTGRIAEDENTLSSAGIDMTSFGPDISSNTVLITLSNYSASAAQELVSQYGPSWITVTPATGSLPVRAADRFTDVASYSGGDAIWFNGNQGGTLCTDAFGFSGNNTGNVFSLTAGHCGGSTVDTNINSPREIGSISTVYYSNNGFDVESFHCDCKGYVWANSGANHGIVGYVDAGVGNLVTMDGAMSGEVPSNTVQQYDYCQKFSDGITTCHVSQTYQAGVTACQGGDSGGPAYQRSSGTNNVYAAGVILGENNAGQTCYYNDISDVLILVNGTLLSP